MVAAAVAIETWGDVDRVDIQRLETIAAPSQDAPRDNPDATAVPEFRLPPVPSASDGTDTLLMVGSDSRSGLDDANGFGDFEGSRADVLMLLIRPRDGQEAAVLSLPRDLWVSTPCGNERLSETLLGCDDMNGESTLLATVESLTGLGVDHMALVDMDGFQEVVDELGGYEICVERPVRDTRANLNLDAGCHNANGEDTLAWLRSRSTQEQREDGSWRTMAGVSDLTRNERQRDFLIAMLGRLGNFGDPQDALSVAQTIAPHVTVDSNLGITQAVSLAWTMRDLDSIAEISVPVEDYTTQAGAQVLVAAEDIESMIADVIAVETVSDADSSMTG